MRPTQDAPHFTEVLEFELLGLNLIPLDITTTLSCPLAGQRSSLEIPEPGVASPLAISVSFPLLSCGPTSEDYQGSQNWGVGGGGWTTGSTFFLSLYLLKYGEIKRLLIWPNHIE